MSPEERRNLEEEFISLKKLLDFYVGFRDNISSMNNQEVDDHINDMPDRLSEIRNQLDL
jgi:hypothetical protein